MNDIEKDWIPATERLPDATDVYKVKTASGKIKKIWFLCDFNGGKVWSTVNNNEQVTHWQYKNFKL